MRIYLNIINVKAAFLCLFFTLFSFAQEQKGAESLAKPTESALKDKVTPESFIKYDDTRKVSWSSGFAVVDIPSTIDKAIQKAYFYKTKATTAKPLIVSLHTWSGNYAQTDNLALLCSKKDVNYIHPDFRGANKTNNACCSDLVLSDIDDAISYAIKNANVDVNKIYVVGVSGGGYATLSTFMKSRHRIKKFSAWASISDLAAWYNESSIMKNKYAKDIFDCTGSGTVFNVENAKQRSPLYMVTPIEKLKDTELNIYVGIYDGLQGSVPITHSINFYNKILTDLSVKDKTKFVSVQEKLDLLEFRKALGDYGQIGDRKVLLRKNSGSVMLTVFEGDHEMLPEYALDQLLKD